MFEGLFSYNDFLLSNVAEVKKTFNSTSLIGCCGTDHVGAFVGYSCMKRAALVSAEDSGQRSYSEPTLNYVRITSSQLVYLQCSLPIG